MIELRPYQHQTIDALLAHWHEGAGNPLVDMATGTGKSVVIGEFARQLIGAEPSLRILMLVHARELIEQNAMALLRIWPDAPLGIYSAGLGRREADAQIVYASINSVYRLDAETLGRRDIVLIDEAHRVPLTGEGMYRRVLETHCADRRPICASPVSPPRPTGLIPGASMKARDASLIE